MSEGIPEDWEWEKIQNLTACPIRDFGSFSTTKLIEFLHLGVPFIKSESVKKGTIDFSSVSYISEDVHKLLDKSYVNAGDILFTKIGAIGRAALYNGELGVCNSNAATAKITIDSKKADSKYVTYQLVGERVTREFEKSIISTPPRINLGEINSMKIECPPLLEQQKIAAILTSVDNVIEKTEAQIRKLQDLKKGMMQELLTKGIGHTEFKDSPVGRIPKGWEVATIKGIEVLVIDGDRGKEYPKEGEFFQREHCLFLSAKNVTRNGFKFEECSFITEEKDRKLRKGKLEKDDIVITTRGTVGNIAYFDDTVPFDSIRINSGMAILRNKSEHIETDFLYDLLQSPIIREQIAILTFGSAQPQLTISIINDFLVPIPSKIEQHRISMILANVTNRLQFSSVITSSTCH
jgi:type I restriction enzyme S subunit